MDQIILKCNSFIIKIHISTFRLALVLSNLGYSCGELSSDIKMKRKKVLSKLKNGTIRVLVCSDALGKHSPPLIDSICSGRFPQGFGSVDPDPYQFAG